MLPRDEVRSAVSRASWKACRVDKPSLSELATVPPMPFACRFSRNDSIMHAALSWLGPGEGTFGSPDRELVSNELEGRRMRHMGGRTSRVDDSSMSRCPYSVQSWQVFDSLAPWAGVLDAGSWLCPEDGNSHQSDGRAMIGPPTGGRLLEEPCRHKLPCPELHTLERSTYSTYSTSAICLLDSKRGKGAFHTTPRGPVPTAAQRKKNGRCQ